MAYYICDKKTYSDIMNKTFKKDCNYFAYYQKLVYSYFPADKRKLSSNEYNPILKKR